MTRYVYDFADGDRTMADLLGGKGANLAEMTRLGLPVPPGFTVTTEACRAYLGTDSLPAGLVDEIGQHLRRVEADLGRRFGDPADPLLLSVRSGARFSMPGMMETILDIGLNDTTVDGVADRERRRTVRVGLVPATHPDVRPDRAAASPASGSRRLLETARTHRRRGQRRRPVGAPTCAPWWTSTRRCSTTRPAATSRRSRWCS